MIWTKVFRKHILPLLVTAIKKLMNLPIIMYMANSISLEKRKTKTLISCQNWEKSGKVTWNTIVGQHNINSLRSNFLSIKELLVQNLDLLIIRERKWGDSFPNAQLQINGYKFLRKDRNIFGGRLCLYIIEDIPSKQIHTKLLERLESICIK